MKIIGAVSNQLQKLEGFIILELETILDYKAFFVDKNVNLYRCG